jgi:hypothetical protein
MKIDIHSRFLSENHLQKYKFLDNHIKKISKMMICIQEFSDDPITPTQSMSN